MSDHLIHGTFDGYNNHRCRCEACREAGRKYRQENLLTPCPGGCGRQVQGRYRPDRLCNACTRKLKRKPLEHGTETDYKKGCRCDRCRAAAAAGRRERRARSRQ